jgi:Leucine-rich repeat (LRR) protein
MFRKYPVKNFIVSFLICVAFMSLCADKTLRGADSKNRAGVLELLRTYQTKQEQITTSRTKERVVRFPEDVTIGRLYIVTKPPPEKRLWYAALVWENKHLGESRGEVKLPTDGMLRLDVVGDAWRKAQSFAALEPNDVQILNLFGCKDIDDYLMLQIGRLTGLEVLFIGDSTISARGLQHLTKLKNLKAFSIYGYLSSEDLVYLYELPLLEYLCFNGPMVNDKKVAAIGKITWLTQLSIGGGQVGAGLAYLKDLKSLRCLNLSELRNPNINRDLIHITGLTNLEEMVLENAQVGNAGLAHLSKLPKLKRLNLEKNPITKEITDAGMVYIKDIISLEELVLPYDITDAGVEHLSTMASLKKINLGGHGITDKSMARLAQMKSLERLEILSNNVTDAGMEKLSHCPNLKSLKLTGTPITDEGLPHLTKIKTLNKLDLNSTQVTGKGLAVLKALPQLTEFSFLIGNLGEDATSNIGQIKTLTYLSLRFDGSDLTEEDLAHLSNLSSLKTLYITTRKPSKSLVTDTGIAHLEKLKSLEILSIISCANVTDTGLKHLEGLTSLKHLRLDKSKITMAGVAGLQEKIPNVIVVAPCTMQDARTQQKTTRQPQLRK